MIPKNGNRLSEKPVPAAVYNITGEGRGAGSGE
jgi:hypothetical protein